MSRWLAGAPYRQDEAILLPPSSDLTSWTMPPKARPTDEDHLSAARLGLSGLMAGEHSEPIMAQLAAMHPRNNTFPAEVLLELAAEAIAERGRHQPSPSNTRACAIAISPSTTFVASHSSTRATTP